MLFTHLLRVAPLLNSGGYASWGKTRTSNNGTFSVSERISVFPAKARKIRVKVKFVDKELGVVAGALAAPLKSKWYTVYQSAAKQRGPTINIGTKRFRSGATGNLGRQEYVRQATIWHVCKKIMRELERRDSWFAFKKKITIVYPAKVISKTPYANGVTRCAYIHKNTRDTWWSLETVIHEVMHLWNYDHNTGTSNWLQAVCDGNTHSFQEKPAIAFHEGFAEYAMDDLLHEIWGLNRVEPFNRHSVRNRSGQALTNLKVVEGSDEGVTNALHTLTTPDIYTRTFGTRTSTTPRGSRAGTTTTTGRNCPRSPNLDLWDVLSSVPTLVE